jgi:hypothetical protein
VKNDPELPSGPTKVNGPVLLSLAAAWKRRVVPVGAVLCHDNVDQLVEAVPGLLSFVEEIRSPALL